MNMNNKNNMYVYNDFICFRICDLSDGEKKVKFGNCTNFEEVQENFKTYYICNQYGVHLHCVSHPEIELNYCYKDSFEPYLICPKCKQKIKFLDYENVHSIRDLYQECLKVLNYEKLNIESLIRLDDWYYPEKKKKDKTDSGYWITTNVKTDKNGDTMIVLYIGNSDEKFKEKKIQYFIQPEKGKLSHDHKDLDPKDLLSKIEVTLKDRVIEEKYND